VAETVVETLPNMTVYKNGGNQPICVEIREFSTLTDPEFEIDFPVFAKST
jgi:hypothetical protein